MNRKLKVLCLVYLCINNCGILARKRYDGNRLQPSGGHNLTDLNIALPNIRVSLSDCPMVYFKYGENGVSLPVGAGKAFLREFAHMAAIGWTRANGSIDWDCGGSLITENIILTAAHCTSRDKIAPDVVRMGDLNLFSDQDDQYAQQRKISKIVRHEKYKFSSNYFDIALLFLEKPIEVHDTVCPACLWNDHKFDFRKLIATGWGATGHGKERTPNLLKVTLQPMNNPECNLFYDANRKIPNGIVEEQLCAGDEIMDTCPGDSGGPLEIKLLGYDTLTPFIVGVTSFGPACGFSTPAVYTRVSSYIDWISSKTNTSYDPIECTLRYYKFRDFEPDIVHNFEGLERYDFTRAHVVGSSPYNNKALLGIGNNKEQFVQTATGILISDNYILTTASAISANKTFPTAALFKSGLIAIEKITVHPQFDLLTHAHDIALIRLQKDIVLDEAYELPSCLWRSIDLPDLEQFDGIGLVPTNKDTNEDFSVEPLSLKFNVINKTECAEIYKNHQSVPFLDQNIDLRNGISNDQFCAGYTRFFLVPGICQFDYGNTVQRRLYFNWKYFIYDFGLNSLGHQCGFGVPAIMTRISSYVDWIDSVVFEKAERVLVQMENNRGLYFSDDDYKLGDKCTYKVRNDGECVAPENCPEWTNSIKTKMSASVFCALHPSISICCPDSMIAREITVGFRNRIRNECSTSFLQEKIKYRSFNFGISRHLAFISNDVENQRPCLGSLISLNYVLASAKCVTAMSEPNLVRLGTNDTRTSIESEQKFGIADIVVHPRFFSSMPVDMALIKMDGSARVNFNVIPACLWQNRTHTPFQLFSLGLGESSNINITTKIAIQNARCKRKFYPNLNDDALCVDSQDLEEAECDEQGDNILSAVWWENEVKNHYIVGLFSEVGSCPSVYQRILPYIEWINLIIN